MPSNPVDEARLRVMHWATMSDAALLEMGVDRQDEVFHAVNALIAESDRRAIQQERSRYEGLLAAAEARLQRIASVAVVRGRCVFCAHPDDPADGTHTSTCPVAPEPDPCPYVHDSGDRCVLQFEHGGSHDLGY